MSEPDTPAAMVWILYIMLTCVCTFLLLGLYVAVVTGTFAQVHSSHLKISVFPVKKMAAARQHDQECNFHVLLLNVTFVFCCSIQVREAEGTSGFTANVHSDSESEADVDWIANGPSSRPSKNNDAKSPPLGLILLQAAHQIAGTNAAKRRRLSEGSATKNKGEPTSEEAEEVGGAIVQKFALDILLNHWTSRFFSLVVVVHCFAMTTDQYVASNPRPQALNPQLQAPAPRAQHHTCET